MDYALASFDSAAASNVVCDTVTKMTNFDGAAYMGVWYEQDHVVNQGFQLDSWTCTQAKYSNLDATGHFTVRNTSDTASFGNPFGVTGTGYCPDKSGQCFVSFFGAKTTAPNYSVVETDYTSYSVVYQCDSKQYLGFLTRDNIISDALYNKMLGIAKQKLPHFDFTKLAARDYQGPKCHYESPTMILQ